MDFKIAGTHDSITSVQADIKIAGLPFKIVRQAIESSQGFLCEILVMSDDIYSSSSFFLLLNF